MKNKKCIVCGGHHYSIKRYNDHLYNPSQYSISYLKSDLYDFFLNKSIFKGKIRICADCGFGTMVSPPSEEQLQKYYEGQYWDDRSFMAEINNHKNDIRAVTQIELTNKYVPLNALKNVLEIGAGPAYASLLLKNANQKLNLYSCEPGIQWIDYYKENGIVNLSTFFPFETEILFDYIHTSHWLEHVLDLEKTITCLLKMMSEGACLFVEVPNTTKEYWNVKTEDVPHIHFFTQDSLKRIFENNGFKCIYIDEYGITFSQFSSGISITSDTYKANKLGIWIRAIFQKI